MNQAASGVSTLTDQIMSVMQVAFDPAFGEAWNRRQISEALALPHTRALLIDQNGKLLNPDQNSCDAQVTAGFALTRHAADEEELLLIAVRPEFRTSGLGSKLISFLIEDARKRHIKKIFLEMRRGNPAVFLYGKAGFKPIGERPQYYRLANGTKLDAITFAREV